MAFSEEELLAIAELMAASRAFLDEGVVDVTCGTMPLQDRLKEAMDHVDRLIDRGSDQIDILEKIGDEGPST